MLKTEDLDDCIEFTELRWVLHDHNGDEKLILHEIVLNKSAEYIGIQERPVVLIADDEDDKREWATRIANACGKSALSMTELLKASISTPLKRPEDIS